MDSRPLDLGIVSVVPSPYQRDVFAALALRPEVNLCVRYLCGSMPGSPWPGRELAPFEKILPGFAVARGDLRYHWNWRLSEVLRMDVVVLNTLMSFTAQRLMRFDLRGRPWIFWGERLGPRRGAWHEAITAPLHRASAIVGIGSLAERDYRARFPEPRHFCIPYHCELQPFFDAPRPHRDQHEIAFLFCGQMIARKGVDVLLAAFDRVARKHPRARLLLVGREAELPEMLAALRPDLRARIDFAGFQAPEALPDFFAKADVFVLPSRYDGWGVVVNQALGAGLPILCSDAAGAGHDLVEPGSNGLLFPSEAVEALSAAMDHLAMNPRLVSEWGAASRRKAGEWTPSRAAAKWIEVLTELGEVKTSGMQPGSFARV